MQGSQSDLKPLRLEGYPQTKRRMTTDWIETIKDVLRTNYKTMHILEDYPSLPKSIPLITNQALGSFLCANVAAHVKNILADTNPKDGLRILCRLQEIYTPASIKDHNKAITYLQQLQMHPKDTMTNFVTKYNRALKTLADVSIGFAPPQRIRSNQHVHPKIP